MTDAELNQRVWHQVWWQFRSPSMYDNRQISIPPNLRHKLFLDVRGKIEKNTKVIPQDNGSTMTGQWK
jgi:hypothetical protein